MPNYSTPDSLPVMFTSDHFQSWDEAARRLAIANAIIMKCEKCGFPVSEERKTCDQMMDMLDNLNATFRGPQAQVPEVLKS